MKKIISTATFEKNLKEVENIYLKNIFERVEKIPTDRDFLDIKKMEPKHLGLYRLRVGKYRIIFDQPDEETIRLLKIDSRDSIYK